MKYPPSPGLKFRFYAHFTSLMTNMHYVIYMFLDLDYHCLSKDTIKLHVSEAQGINDRK